MAEEELSRSWSHEAAAHDAALAASVGVPSRVRRRAKSSRTARSKLGLHRYDSLPDYLRDNEFIQTGYRYNLPFKDTVKSLFNLHNETGNVWSHLIGFILFVCLTVWVYKSPPAPLVFAKPQIDDVWQSVVGNLQQLRGSMGENLQHFQHSLHKLPSSMGENLHQLQESLHKLSSLQSLQHSLTSGVHSLQDSWSSGVHSLQESLTGGVHSLQDRVQHGAHALADRLYHDLATLVHEAWPFDYSSSKGGSKAPTSPEQPPTELLTSRFQWPTPRWPMYIFCAGAMSCLLLSAICHLFGCCQKHVSMMIWRFDYAGIALLIVSSFYPIVYYGFMCTPYLACAYLLVITLLGSLTVAMSLMDRFQLPEWRSTRAGLFVTLGMMGVVPVVHQLVVHKHVWHVRTAVLYDIGMGVSYLSGAAVYALRMPERWAPGKFDMLLHSHQIFHVMVVVGAYLHWRATLLMLEWRDASGGCAVPITRGPLTEVLQELSAAGHSLLSVDQVWDGIRAAAAEHLDVLGFMQQQQQPLMGASA